MTDVPVQSRNESLRIGAIIGDTFSIFFGRFFQVFLLSLLPILVLVLCGVLIVARLALDPVDADAPSILDIVGIVLLGLVVFAGYFLTTALIVRLAYDAMIGNPMRIGSYFSSAFGAIVPIVACSVVISICALAAIFAVMIVPAYAIGGFVAVISFVPAVIAGLYVYAMWIAVIPAIVVERAGLSGLGRSLALTRNYRWSCVGAVVLMFFCLLGIALVNAVVQYVLNAIAGELVASLFGILVSGISMAFSGIFTALLYARLREIKEGTSVEQLAEVFA